MSRLKALGSDSPELASVMEDFTYAGIDTCAADGLCATACPVNINTGEFVKHLRAEYVKNKKSAQWIADHFALAEKTIGWSVRLGHLAEKVIGVQGVKSVSIAAEKITGKTFPKWNNSIPYPDSKVFAKHPGGTRLWNENQRQELLRLQKVHLFSFLHFAATRITRFTK